MEETVVVYVNCQAHRRMQYNNTEPYSREKERSGVSYNKMSCDLGASVSIVPKIIFDKLNFTQLTPTPMHLQLADFSVCYPEQIVEDVLVEFHITPCRICGA